MEMGKVMLAVLCFIPLVLCGGSLSPPVTFTSGSQQDHTGMIENLENVIVQINSWREELTLKTTSWAQGLHIGDTQVFVSIYDAILDSVKKIVGYLREMVPEDSASPSRAGNVQYPVESPMEKLSLESAAFSIPFYKGKPREGRNQQRTGPIRAKPGFHFPEYTDIPDTSFDCSSQAYIPGMYADPETGCQVFHVCWPHKKESFLCPIGTTFNQAILACDFWYNSDCALSYSYYDVNVPTDWIELSKLESVMDLLNKENSESVVETDAFRQLRDLDLTYVSKMFPVKAKVTVFRNPRSTDFKGVEMSIDGEKAEEDVDVTEELAETPELASTERSLNLQPGEPRAEIDSEDREDATETPLHVVPRKPRTVSDGVELGTTKLPLILRSREPRAESDSDELEDTTERPLRIVPRRPRTESKGVELGTTILPLTLQSREPSADVELGDRTELPLLAIPRKPRAHKDPSTFAVMNDVLGLVRYILRDAEIYYMVSDEKSRPPHVRIPTSVTPPPQGP